MAIPEYPKTETLFTEAPVSWNTRYIDANGFECQLTLRGDSGKEVLEKAEAAITFLLNTDCQPNSHHKPSLQDNAVDSEAGSHNGNGHDRSWCPIHEVEMKRWEKNGRTWYSHKVGDAWCSGKQKSK